MTCLCHPPGRPGDPRAIQVTAPPSLLGDLAGLTAGECAAGAVVVLLDEDGHPSARILADGTRDPLAQLDAAAEALDRARALLSRFVQAVDCQQ